jgi:hypothetical protein
LQGVQKPDVIPDGSLEVFPVHPNGSRQVIICEDGVPWVLVEESVQVINCCLELTLHLAGDRLPVFHMTTKEQLWEQLRDA